MRKRNNADACHAVRDRDLRQPRAFVKRTIADACHAVRDRDRRQPRAFGKRIAADILNAVVHRDGYYVLSGLIPRRNFMIVRATSRTVKIVCHDPRTLGQVHGRNTCAIGKCITVNACAARHCDRLKPRAVGKRRISDACHAISDRDRLKSRAVIKRI